MTGDTSQFLDASGTALDAARVDGRAVHIATELARVLAAVRDDIDAHGIGRDDVSALRDFLDSAALAAESISY